jgi:methionyl-tRNA synthetase
VNDTPHVGTSYTTIVADILTRWNKLKSRKVYFLTGLDENSIKTLKASGKKSRKEIQKYTDEMSKKWESIWKELNIDYNELIRTTSKRHREVVINFFNKVYKKGDVYKKKYSGPYCNDCEVFYKEKDLVNGNCPIHKKKCEIIEEENYFFKLTKYSGRILKHIEKNPKFILPISKRNEVIGFIKQGLEDISISRPDYGWGINLPIDNTQVFWVWFDALLNYISGSNGNWPADLHLIGKDILRFHCIIWPAMLFSAGYKLPKQIFAHGFFTVNGEKISKSLGNAISPIYISKKYGVDSLRYFLLRHIPFGQDGDFSEKALKDRHNNELADKLGNLVSRTATLAEKYGLKEVNFEKIDVDIHISNVVRDVSKLMEQFEFDKALNSIFAFIDVLNQFVQDGKIWETGSKEDLFELVTGIRLITVLLWPFIPETSEKIAKQFGFKISLKELDKPLKITKIKKGEILFKKI